MQREADFLRAWTERTDGGEAVDGPIGSADGRMRYRSVWISDLHLGTPGCQAEPLLDFLKNIHCDNLFLVGDIIDGWQLKRSW